MGWLYALIPLVVAGGGIAWALRRRLHRHCGHIEEMLDDLEAGREPRAFVFDRGSRLIPIVKRLESLAAGQERMRAERRRQEENLRIILASMDEGVMVVDSRRELRVVNPSLLRLFSLSANPLGRSVLQALREPVFDEMVGAALHSGEAQSREVTIEDGQTRQFAVHAAPMRDAAGEPGVVAMFRDITRLKQLEDIRREFVANVSHELRTPLSIFQGYLETLLDAPDLPTDERVPVLEVMRKHSQRLNALVEDLLTLARLESRDSRPQLLPLAIERVLRDAAADWARPCAGKDVGIAVECEPGLPALSGDESQLAQVFNNLIENALKYSPVGGCITLRAGMRDGGIELRVEDSGPGIPPEDLPHIFGRFYRADKARTREQGGTGLGLAIVKHIVMAHGGTVEAQSEPGRGTEIVLRFPLAAPAA